MYTHTNYRSGKALKDAFKAGEKISCFQPNDFFGASLEGDAVIEGPHFPEAHKFYVAVVLEHGVIVKIKK